MKEWTIIFRALANINRLKILEMLAGGKKMNVGSIAGELGISFKATSNHLAILKNLSVLEAQGISGHVFYSLNPQLSRKFRLALNLFLSRPH